MPRFTKTDNPPVQKGVITVPPMQSFEDVRQVLAQVMDAFQTQLLAQFPITNYEGRRISNVGVPSDADDVVTLKYLVGAPPNPQVETNVVNNNSGGGGLPLRTIDLKDTTVGDDIADATIVKGTITGQTSTVVLVAGVLRTPISEDLVVRINVWVDGVSSEVGTFTIPAATAINTAVSFTTFVTTALPDMSVLTWDVTGSDGSIDGAGVASISIWWE